MRYFLFAVLLTAQISFADYDEFELKDRNLLFGMEVGQIASGTYDEGDELDMQGHVIRRIPFLMGKEIVIDESFSIHFGLGGVMYYFFPVNNTQYFTKGSRTGLGLSFGYGLKQWDWGGTLQFGVFHHKYNPQAKNLGEYLFRSGTYPGIRYTGGYTNINSAKYKAEGFKFTLSHMDGAMKHEFTLFSETSQVPTIDVTPTYVWSFNIADIVELGAGASFNRYIPTKPSKLSPKTNVNTYYEFHTPLPAQAAVGDTTILTDQKVPYFLANNYADPVSGEYLMDMKNPADTSQYLYPRDTLYYTQKGIKLMGRIVFNLPLESKIYGELALLGVKDYPFYYENKFERLPLMFGFSLPTFGLFDNLSFEMEYLKAKFGNDIRQIYSSADPVWPAVDMTSLQESLDQAKGRNWKWSLYAAKTISNTMKAYIQVASDHLRTIDYERRPSHTSVIKEPGDWYYMGRFDFGF